MSFLMDLNEWIKFVQSIFQFVYFIATEISFVPKLQVKVNKTSGECESQLFKAEDTFTGK